MKKMPWITLRRVTDRGEGLISIHFHYNKEVVAHLKSLKIARYHVEGKYWYTAAKGFDHKAFAESMRTVAMVNYRALQPGWKPAKGPRPRGAQDPPLQVGTTWGPLTGEHTALAKRFRLWLPQQQIWTHLSELSIWWFSDFLSWLQPDQAPKINRYHLLEYVQEHIVGSRLSVAEQQQVVQTIVQFLQGELKHMYSPFPIKTVQQGGKSVALITRLEMVALLKTSLTNQHRCMLALIYLYGLRIKQLLDINSVDLNPSHQTLRISQNKGGGSKTLPIPDQLNGWLEQYVQEHKTYLWLFEGKEPGSQYPASSLQGALNKALNQCGITRKINLTGLRRSYAAHLMENIGSK